MKKIQMRNAGNVAIIALLAIVIFAGAFIAVRSHIKKEQNLAAGYYGTGMIYNTTVNANTVSGKQVTTSATPSISTPTADPKLICATADTPATTNKPTEVPAQTGSGFSSGLNVTLHPTLTKLKNSGGYCGPYSTVLSKINRFGETEVYSPTDGKKVPLAQDGKVNFNALEAIAARGGPLTVDNTQRSQNLINMYQNISAGEQARVCTRFQPAKDDAASVKDACKKIADNYVAGKKVDCQVSLFTRQGDGHESAIKSVKYDENKGCMLEVYDSLNQTPPLSSDPKTQNVTVAAGTPNDGALNINHPKVKDTKGKPVKYDQVTFMCCE